MVSGFRILCAGPRFQVFRVQGVSAFSSVNGLRLRAGGTSTRLASTTRCVDIVCKQLF